MAFEQQLNKNVSLIYDLLDKSRWKKKWRFGLTTKATKHGDQVLLCDDKELLVQEIATHKDEVVEKLVDMVCWSFCCHSLESPDCAACLILEWCLSNG